MAVLTVSCWRNKRVCIQCSGLTELPTHKLILFRISHQVHASLYDWTKWVLYLVSGSQCFPLCYKSYCQPNLHDWFVFYFDVLGEQADKNEQICPTFRSFCFGQKMPRAVHWAGGRNGAALLLLDICLSNCLDYHDFSCNVDGNWWTFWGIICC